MIFLVIALVIVVAVCLMFWRLSVEVLAENRELLEFHCHLVDEVRSVNDAVQDLIVQNILLNARLASLDSVSSE